MDTEATSETETPSSNGTSPVAAKPWIAAGFKSRDAWRASKGQKTAKPKAKKSPVEKHSDALVAAAPAKPKSKPKKAKRHSLQGVAGFVKAKKKAAKKPAKKVKLKAKSVAKAKKKTPAEKRAAKLRTAKFVKSLAKGELSDKEKKVLKSLAKGKQATIHELAAKCFGSKPRAKGYLAVKNAMRRPVAMKLLKQVDRGTYRRVA
ncbi:MAG: hypothetical protein Q7J25_10295 [Vicinamibacterales bacterium]|nr:hypothetical protein [Vicinamibacterales bacterium]